MRRGWRSWARSAGDQEVKIQQHLPLPKGVLEAPGPDSAQRGTGSRKLLNDNGRMELGLHCFCICEAVPIGLPSV